MTSVTARQAELLGIDTDFDESGISDADKAEAIARTAEKAELYGCSLNMVFIIEVLEARADAAEAAVEMLTQRLQAIECQAA